MARKVEFSFDPFDLVGEDKEGLSASDVKTVMSDVADYVLTEVLDATASQVSAVYGDKWEPLDKEYKKIKKSKGGKPIANLELEGDMLGSLRVIKGAKELKLTVRADQADKADGHNNHSGESRLPLRRFIPSESDGDTFSPSIMKGIERIISNAKASAGPAESDTSNVEDLQALVDEGLKIKVTGSRD